MAKTRKLAENILENKTTDSNSFDSGSKAQFKPIGSSGTEIFSGYFSEEYLQKLRGRAGAKIYDEMRRSESQVAMILNAIMNPIKSATWEFMPAQDVEQADLHKEFIEYNAKEMIDWETHIHEALTMLPFGYSIFEIINNVVFNHPKFGTFNGLKSLEYRNQKTIERWNMNKDSQQLETVEQWVQGDLTPKGGTFAKMDARFLLIFTSQKEGDNFEGISILRPMYGPWFRKNTYLKLVAIGLEKNAIGTPVGTVPTGKLNSAEFNSFKEILSNFVSHESSYLLKPQGWELEIVRNDFDPEKVKEIILMENTEMINSVVANFLALGTNGSGGAYALGTDLSDFFLTGIQSYANIISGVWNRQLIPNLIKLNFGEQKAYPKLKVTNINDKAGKELADIVNALLRSRAISADKPLEDYLRKQYSLPELDEASIKKEEPLPEQTSPNSFAKFSENRLQLAESYNKKWKDNKQVVKEIMQTGLKKILDNYKPQIEKAWDKTNPNGLRNAALELEPKGVKEYEDALKEALAEIATQAINDAKKETPKANKKNIKLAESIKLAGPRGGFYNALPPSIKNIIKNQAGLVAQTQALDINKIVSFQFLSSVDSTEDVNQVLADIEATILPTIEGSTGKGISIDAAAGNSVSNAVNQARMEWFFEPEVLDTIESFTFVNDDPVSAVCQELNGTTWAVGDPDIDRYGPPMHHNCKSRLEPNEKGDDTNPEITRGGTSLSQEALDSITLCECNYHIKLSESKK